MVGGKSQGQEHSALTNCSKYFLWSLRSVKLMRKSRHLSCSLLGSGKSDKMPRFLLLLVSFSVVAIRKILGIPCILLYVKRTPNRSYCNLYHNSKM